MFACMCKEKKNGKHAQTALTRRHGQRTCRQVQGIHARRARAGGGIARASVEKILAHKTNWSTLVFGDVDLCCRLCSWNMHHAQSKARAGGLYVDHPGYCFVLLPNISFPTFIGLKSNKIKKKIFAIQK